MTNTNLDRHTHTQRTTQVQRTLKYRSENGTAMSRSPQTGSAKIKPTCHPHSVSL